MKNSVRKILGLAILLAFLMLSRELLAEQQVQKQPASPSPQTQAPQKPNISEVIPLATELSFRLADLESKIKLMPDLTHIEKAYSAIEIKLEGVSNQVKKLKGHQSGNYAKFSMLKQNLTGQDELFVDINRPLVETIQQLDIWNKEWLVEKERWLDWRSLLLKNRSSAVQLGTALDKAILTINTAQSLILKHIEALMAVQVRGAKTQMRIASLNAAVNSLIAETRQYSMFSKFPPMYSMVYFSQFTFELWDAALEGLRLLAWPDKRFFALHGFTLCLLLLLLITVLLVIYWNRQVFEASELWHFMVVCPVSTALFLCTLIAALQLQLWQAPSIIILINTIIAGVCCARLLGKVLEQVWRRHAVYGIMAAYVVTMILITTGLPSPLLRLYIFLASLIGVRFCLKWAGESTVRNEARHFAWSLRLIALVFFIVMVAQFLGKAGVATYLFTALLMTMAIILPVFLFVYLIRGGLHWIFFSSPVWQIKLMRSAAGDHVRKIGFLIEAAIVIFVLLPAIFTAWEVFDSFPEAIHGLLAPGFAIGDQRVSVGLIMVAAGTLYASLLISQILPKVLLDEQISGHQMERGVRLSVGRLLRYFIILIGVLVTFSMLGLDLTKLTIILSAFGVGIGFGLQSIVNNFVSGLILLFERPLREGDTIEIDNDRAKIMNIGLRATIVQTFEQADVIIPNAYLINNMVTNWTLSNRQVRLSVPVGVAYGSDVSLVVETLLACAREHDAVAKSPAPQVLFLNLGESSLDFELRVWIQDADDRIIIKSELYHEILEKFSEAQIVIPFPQRDLHFCSTEPSVKIQLQKTPC